MGHVKVHDQVALTDRVTPGLTTRGIDNGPFGHSDWGRHPPENSSRVGGFNQPNWKEYDRQIWEFFPQMWGENKNIYILKPPPSLANCQSPRENW